MKKLKIFLLLSILLCFGFALSSEVHASGPKPFEVDEVLPATTQLRIHFNGGRMDVYYGTQLKSDNDNFQFILYENQDYSSFNRYPTTYHTRIYNMNTDQWISPFNATDHNYIDIDTSSWSLSRRTISNVGICGFTWEDLNAPSGFSITFEENGGTSVIDLSEQTALPDPLPTPTKSGYTFLGWYYDSDFTDEAFADDPLTSDVTLYAKWMSGKVFEVADVLPQGIIRISWDETEWFRMGYVLGDPGGNKILSSNNSFDLLDYIYPQVLTYPEPGYLEFIPPYTVYGGGHAYIDIDTREWDLGKRTISTVFWREELTSRLYWEEYILGYSVTYEENGGSEQTDLSGVTVLPDPLPTPTKSGYTFLGWYYDSSLTNRAFPGDTLTDDIVLYAKWWSGNLFQVGDVLPQGKIRVSWDETEWFRMGYVLGDPGGNQILSSNNSFDLLDYIYPQVLTYPEPGYLEFIPPYTVYGGGHAYIDIHTLEWDLSKRTISTVFWREELISRLYWEDITPDGYAQGYLEAREEFGYYDSRTGQWLSVEEYLDLYGTDKPGQSDFYGNFDKYFIPAMIIVFGGAIVLTILKVFKGRE